MSLVAVGEDPKLIIDFSRSIDTDCDVNPIAMEHLHAFLRN